MLHSELHGVWFVGTEHIRENGTGGNGGKHRGEWGNEWCTTAEGRSTPPPPCISYALVQATVGVGTVLIWDLILIRYQT